VEQKANANFYIGKISLDKKDYDNARASFNKVIRAQESSEIAAESRYHIAYIYYLERDLNTALDICQRANRESAQHQYWLAKTIILMSDIYAEKGDLLSARTLLEALLEKYKGDQEIIDTAKAKKAQLDKLSNESSRLNTKPVEKIEFDSGN
jgi:TolA-binding protein